MFFRRQRGSSYTASRPSGYRRALLNRPWLECLEDRTVLAVLHVTTLADSGAGSLRAIVASAANDDSIVFDQSGTIQLIGGAINIANKIAIIGTGSKALIIDAGDLSNIFLVESAATLTLSAMTLQNGGNSNRGGAIEVAARGVLGGKLNVSSVLFQYNSSSFGGGGAIGFDGGGDLNVSNCTFLSNTSSFGDGGAIRAGTGMTTIDNSTFERNGATNGFNGGAIFLAGSTDVGTSVTITSSTIADNSANKGGGIYSEVSGSAVTLRNSILAGNTGTQGPDLYDAYSSFTSAGDYNIFQTAPVGYVPGTNDKSGDPGLAPLGSYDCGCSTQTRAVQAGSIAENTGDPALAGTLDQRGTIRDSKPDIGAFSSAAANQFSFATSPQPISDQSFSGSVIALDSQGNRATTYTGTAHFSSGDLRATLPMDAVFQPFQLGVAGFPGGFTLRKTGPSTITVQDKVSPTVQGIASVNVVPGPTAALAIAPGQPDSQPSGTDLSFTVAAVDAAGNVAPTYLGTVNVSTDDPRVTSLPSYTFLAADRGVHVFHVMLLTARASTVSFQDSVMSGIRGSANVTVVPGPVASFQIAAAQSSPQPSGTDLSFALTVFDAVGNVATNYLGTAQVSTDDPLVPPPGSYTFVVADRGVHVFNVKLLTAGVSTVAVQDSAMPSIRASADVNVLPGQAATFRLAAGQVGPRPSGTDLSFTLAVFDAAGNLATNYAGTVKVSSGDPLAQPPGNYSFIAADQGVHVFHVTLVSGGQQSITFDDSPSGGIVATTQIAVVQPIVTLLGPSSVGENANFPLQIQTTPLGNSTLQSLIIDWDDGTSNSFSALPSFVDHPFTDGPNFLLILATATFQIGTAGQAGSSTVTTDAVLPTYVTVPEVVTQRGAGVAPGRSDTENIPGETGLGGTFQKKGTRVGTTFYLALYNGDPTSVPLDAAAFYDARATKVDSEDRLTLVLRFKPTKDKITLMEFDPVQRKFVPVTGSKTAKIPGTDTSLLVEGDKGSVTVILDDSSFPRLADLKGTIFSIALTPLVPATTPGATPSVNTGIISVANPGAIATPGQTTGQGTATAAGNTVTATFTPALALALPGSVSTASFESQASFQVGSQVTVALSPSQDAPRTQAGSSLSGGGGGLTEEEARKLIETFKVFFGPWRGNVPLPDLNTIKSLLKEAPTTEPASPPSENSVAPMPMAPLEPGASEAAPVGPLDELMRLVPLENPIDEIARYEETTSAAWMLPLPLLGVLTREAPTRRRGRNQTRFA